MLQPKQIYAVSTMEKSFPKLQSTIQSYQYRSINQIAPQHKGESLLKHPTVYYQRDAQSRQPKRPFGQKQGIK